MNPPKPIPADDPVPFAKTAATDAVWPVVTHSSRRFEVNYVDINGKSHGNSPGRRFLAQRPQNKRLHVAVDLFANEGDTTIACQAGKIVAFQSFYNTSAGEEAWAIYIDHGDFVINYGEVSADAPKQFGWKVGDKVKAGQPIAKISSTSMLHFETYVHGTTRNRRWYEGEKRPPELLNPTAYLLSLVENATGLLPAGSAPLPGVPFLTAFNLEGHGSSNSHPKPVIKEFIQSPNHSSRNGAVIDAIVLHCTECSLEVAISTFLDTSGQTSAHYIMDRNGEIVQMVRDSDRAHHCRGANAKTIGIEHVGTMTDAMAPAQARASAELIRWLLEQYGIPRTSIYGHNFAPDYTGETSCPDHLFGAHTQAAVEAWVQANV